MPIINLCSATDEGATGHHNGAGFPNRAYEKNADGSYIYAQGPSAYWTRLSHVGLCISDYERNGYDDSDFFMVVWNPEKQEPETILFASTRGWSYPCMGSSPDATPEVIAEYRDWGRRMEVARKARIRSEKALKLADQRRSMIASAKAFGFPYQRLLVARRLLNADQFSSLMWLLNAKVRSGFKLSMRQQAILWLKEQAPKYPTPLSKKQFEFIPHQKAA